MSEFVSLTEPIKAIDPATGKVVDIVAIDASSIAHRLIVIERGPQGIWAKTIEYADEIPQ